MSTLARIAAGALVCFGLLHLGMTPRSYALSSREALWFAGTGIMLIAAGLLTFAATLSAERFTRFSSIVVNLLGFTLAILAVPALDQPHVYVLIVFFAAALAGVSALIFQRGT